jgi:CO/xanthine dehydrogenase FAD-binding subunit
LYDGQGANTLNQNNGTITGNIGIGGTGKFAAISGEHITAPTPEPASIVLLVMVLLGAVLVIKRRSRRRKTA